ncbi:MAG: T9SS type A sorting domain-containing protein, partial [Saprospiraceae bacterium]
APTYDAAAQNDQVVIFPDFGTAGAGETFYVDNLQPADVNSIRETLDENVAFDIYPNPANGVAQFALKLPTNGTVSYHITDIAGRALLTESLGQLSVGNHQQSVDLAQLPAGTYFVLLQVENTIVQFEKLMIQR